MAQEVGVRWSRNALRQVKKIGEYIELDSPWQAERVVQRIYSVAERLQWSPTKGKLVPECRDPNLREFSVLSWRVIYRIKSEELVEIVAVVHGKRLLREEMLAK